MAQMVTIYTHLGVKLNEVLCDVEEARWTLNGTGQAKITIGWTEPKLTEELARYGNLVLIEWDNGIEDWGGVIREKGGNTDQGVSILARTAEDLLIDRFTRRDLRGTPGGMFADLIAQANEVEDLRLRVGEISGFGADDQLQRAEARMMNDMLALIHKGGGDWAFVPKKDVGQKLYFECSYYEHRGTDQPISLREGEHGNLKLEGDIWREQGKVANHIAVIASQIQAGKTNTAYATSEESRNLYGIRQGLGTDKRRSMQDTADQLRDKYKHQRRTFTPIAVGDFSYLGLGDTVGLKLVRAAFGIDTRVRILEKRYDVTTGEMPLVVDEVL